MNSRILTLLLIALVLVPQTQSRAETDLNFSQAYLSKVLRHLYHWHLNETALLKVDDAEEVEFLVRSLNPKLDEGDRSQFCEMLVPQLSYMLTLKKADYDVSEMKLPIENNEFRVLRVEKYEIPPQPREAYTILRLSKTSLLQSLFASRNVIEFPDAALIERMRKALREQLREQYKENSEVRDRDKEQTLYFAPISPISNDLWVYWENGGKIIRFSSDTDLNSKAYWEYEKLGIRIYDLRTFVVVSVAETSGSNAFVTRDWASRVLFNCLVHGRRMLITPEADINKPVKLEDAPATAR